MRHLQMERVLVLMTRANLEDFGNRKEMTNKSNVEITISSDLDYECLIAEINIDGKFIGLLTSVHPKCRPSRNINFGAAESLLKPG